MSETKDKIAIITDSCADVPKEYVDKYNIFVLPMVITCSTGEYRDGVDISAADIYEIQKNELPKTSSPAGADVLDTFEEVKRQGYNKAIMIMLSSGLSGTFGYMKMMADDEDELEVEVFDSYTASIGIGVIAIAAAQYATDGVDFETLKNKVNELITNTKVFFSIDTLEYLQKGGRIGKVTAVAGTVLNIKPVLSFDADDGQIYTAAKVRGRKQVESALLKLVGEYKESKEQNHLEHKYNLVIADGGAPERRDELEAKIKELYPDYQEIIRANIGAALSVYLGDNLLGAGIQFVD